MLSQFNNSVKKGSTKEGCLASRAIGAYPALCALDLKTNYCLTMFLFGGLSGLLAITLGAGSSSHEVMDESHPQLSKVLQSWSDVTKMISVRNLSLSIWFPSLVYFYFYRQ